MSEPRVGMLVSRMRVEEKLLVNAFAARDVDVELVDVRRLVLDVATWTSRWDLVLDRCLQASHAIAALRLLAGRGVITVNSADVVTACADKVSTSSLLAAAGVAQPRTLVAFSPDGALRAVEELGYPAVIKPPVGSWGRLLARVNDRDAAEAVLDHKATLGSVAHHVYYVQEHIAKPGRDIRAFVVGGEVVCAIERSSEHWVTNTARGAVASNRAVTSALADLALRAAGAVGGGVLAVDLLEDGDRLLVSEVNHSMEFRNSISVTGVDIAARIVDHALHSVGRAAPVAVSA
ncbi:MAG TPA: lysine biosynthesis protein LysX [Candidatus Dormibacteraeota bacterium]|nr:lysine biosynthesis protein LysX [Candidatus Dormibacteraeota bacterium]